MRLHEAAAQVALPGPFLTFFFLHEEMAQSMKIARAGIVESSSSSRND